MGREKERMVIVLGFGSLYNHAYTPNGTYKENYREKTIDFIALRDIMQDEEITVNYIQEKKEKNPLWFEVGKKE